MNQLSVETGTKDQGAVSERQDSYVPLLLTAWLGTLLLSRLPQILLGELGILAPEDWSV